MSTDKEVEALGLLVDIVTLAKNEQDYTRELVQLKKLLPEAPAVQQSINEWVRGIDAKRTN